MSSSSLYDDLMSDGKKLAAQGKLFESLSKFEHARKLQETPKVLQRIQRLREFIKQNKLQTPAEYQGEKSSVKKTKDAFLKPETPIERHHDVLQEIQNIAETAKLPDNPSELSPEKLIEFNKLKKDAMSFSYDGQFQDALNTFQKALKLCDCPVVKNYIKEIQVMISKHDSELQEFRQLTYSGKKLAQSGKKNLSVKKLKDAYDICPSPKISKIIKTLDDRNSPISKKLFNSDSTMDSSKAEESPLSVKPAGEVSEFSINTTGGSSSDSTAQQVSDPQNLSPASLCKFKNLYKKARVDASEGRLQESLNALKEALSICKTDKLLRRIKDLENHIRDSVEDDSDDQMVAVADGFYIFHGIYEKLYPYQRLGVAWMYGLYQKRKGGVLGDDMGLGKTFQVIAFLSGLIDADLAKHILIIMPVSLLTNWEREFAKWCPGIKVFLFHGSTKKERERNALKVQRKGHVLLTSYGMVVNNVDSFLYMDGEPFIWDYVILDEGHKIKNPTKTTKAVHEVPAKNRLVLTGTPIQNNLRELWALYDFVHQGALLGSMKTFKMQYENIITRAREKDATVGEKRLGTEMAENLKKLIQPYFLRRTKSEIWGDYNEKTDVNDIECKMADLRISDDSKQMSRKNDLIIWLTMSEQQCEIYRNFLHSEAVKTILVSKRSPLVELTTLKKICDHPRLLSKRACLQLGLNGELDEEDLRRELDNESSAASSIANVSDETLIIESGKMKFLISLLENLKENGHRTLVFSLSRKILDMIHRILLNRKWKVVRIDGTVTKTEEREKLIQKFQRNASYPVFLLTTQVGGVGITLTAADRVVIYDPSWNPATDAQAVDRAYRIGQKKNVVIYRLMTCGTVEEKIYRRQIFKDSITKQATGSSDPYRYFSKQELRELFVLDNANYSATQVQLSRMHSDERKTDCYLDEHIAFLHSLDIFGISDHDLMFTKNIKDDTEDNDESAISHDYIKKQVAAAQERIQAEAAVVEDGLRLAGSYARPYTESIPSFRNNYEKDFYKAPSLPEIIDLTQESIEISSQLKNRSDEKDEDDVFSSATPEGDGKFCKVMSGKKDNLKYKPLSLEKNKITDYYCHNDSLSELTNKKSPKQTSTKDYSLSNRSNDNHLNDSDTVSKSLNATGKSDVLKNSFSNDMDNVRESLNKTSEAHSLKDELDVVEHFSNESDVVEISFNKTGETDVLKDKLSTGLDNVRESLNKTSGAHSLKDELGVVEHFSNESDVVEISFNKTGETDVLKNSFSKDLDNVRESLNKTSGAHSLKDELDVVEISFNKTGETGVLKDNFSNGSGIVGESLNVTGKSVLKDNHSNDFSNVEENFNETAKPDVSNDLDVVEKSLIKTERDDQLEDNLAKELGEVTENLIKTDISSSLSDGNSHKHSFGQTTTIAEKMDTETSENDFVEKSDSKNDHALSTCDLGDIYPYLCLEYLPASRLSSPGMTATAEMNNPDIAARQTPHSRSLHHFRESPSFNNQTDLNADERKDCKGNDLSETIGLPITNKVDSPYSPSDLPLNTSSMCKTSSPVSNKRMKELTMFLNESLNELSFISRPTSTLKKRKSCARNTRFLSESDSSEDVSSGANTSQERIVSESDEDQPGKSVSPHSVPSTPLANIPLTRSPRITPLRLRGNYASPVDSPFARALASSPLIEVTNKAEASFASVESPIMKKKKVKKIVIASDSEEDSEEESSTVSTYRQNKSNNMSSCAEESDCFITSKSSLNSMDHSSFKNCSDSFSD